MPDGPLAETKKAPPKNRRGSKRAVLVRGCSVAHVDRPAEAEMVVPMMVRQMEHL